MGRSSRNAAALRHEGRPAGCSEENGAEKEKIKEAPEVGGRSWALQVSRQSQVPETPRDPPLDDPDPEATGAA